MGTKNNSVGRPRIFKTPDEVIHKWESYKKNCNNKESKKVFKMKDEVLVRNVPTPISPTIEGFCIENKISRSSFYNTYKNDSEYKDIFARMQEEVAQLSRQLFETGQLPSSLAPLWMSKHGYSAKIEQKSEVTNTSNKELTNLLKILSDE